MRAAHIAAIYARRRAAVISQGWNSADSAAGNAISNSNRSLTKSSGSSMTATRGIVGVSAGKYYWEVYVSSLAGNPAYFDAGIALSTSSLGFPGGDNLSIGYYGASPDQALYKNSANLVPGAPTFKIGDTLGFALDMDAGKFWAAKNNTWLAGSPSAGTGAPASGLTGTWYPILGLNNVEMSGTGNFKAADQTYTAPTGFGGFP